MPLRCQVLVWDEIPGFFSNEIQEKRDGFVGIPHGFCSELNLCFEVTQKFPFERGEAVVFDGFAHLTHQIQEKVQVVQRQQPVGQQLFR